MANIIPLGVSKGDIVESGSNSYGSYVKWSDGTMLMWGVTGILPSGNNSITYPQTLATVTGAVMTSGLIPNASPALFGCYVTSTVTGNIFMNAANNSAGWQVIGKWSSVSAVGRPTYSIGRGIIESGANSYGSYVKYEDGTMECWGTLADQSLACTSLSGSNYSSPTISVTMPQTFAAVPSVQANLSKSATGGNGAFWLGSGVSVNTTSIFYLIAWSSASATQVYNINWKAIGRWQSATNMIGSYTYGQGVVETATNSNGTYVKFDNGTLLQYGTIAETSKTFVLSTTVYTAGQQTITFPMSFLTTDYAINVMINASTNLGCWAISRIDTDKLVSSQGFYYAGTASATINAGCTWQAVGKWK